MNLPVHLIERQIDAVTKHIEATSYSMQFADHGAYGQDRDRLAKLIEELRQWRQLKNALESP